MVALTEQKQKVEAALASLKRNANAGAMAAPVAASLIVAAVQPLEDNAGAMFYRLKAERWLSLLLATEPDMGLEQLAERTRALAAVSMGIQAELGGIPGRLSMLGSESN